MARRGRGRRREPRAKPRRRRREPTPFALIVAGQIRMLRDPRLLENWRASVLEPLRPAVFMSVNTQWTAAAWVTFSHEHVRLQKICQKRRVRRGGRRVARPMQMPSDIDNQIWRGLCRTVLRP